MTHWSKDAASIVDHRGQVHVWHGQTKDQTKAYLESLKHAA
jgi:hypothetical protein